MTITPFLLLFLLIIIVWFIKENSLNRILQVIYRLTISIILLIVSLIVLLWGVSHWGMYKRLNDPNKMIGCNPSWCECPLLCPNPCECRGCDESGGDCYNLNESISICISLVH